jgi:hypothetical protein
MVDKVSTKMYVQNVTKPLENKLGTLLRPSS